MDFPALIHIPFYFKVLESQSLQSVSKFRYEGVRSAQTCTHLPTEDSAAAQVTQNMALQKVQCCNDYNMRHLVSEEHLVLLFV